jgi:hypothetical protein
MRHDQVGRDILHDRTQASKRQEIRDWRWARNKGGDVVRPHLFADCRRSSAPSHRHFDVEPLRLFPADEVKEILLRAALSEPRYHVKDAH